LFVALRGEQFDGHDYVEAALARGACAALVEKRALDRYTSGVGPLLAVDNALAALGQMAARYRARFDVPVVGITGSSGKTTTKEMVASVLERRYNVLKTVGSENNEIGVPRTLLNLNQQHEAVVLELAARKEGDIHYLCTIAQPTIGVLLNIGSAHLEFFGSVEGVAKAKGELLEYLDESLTALINADDRVVCQEVLRTKGRLLTFGFQSESKFRGEGLILDQEGCGHFLLRTHSIDLKIPGKHNAYNALAAAAIGDVLGVEPEAVCRALSEFRPVDRRTEVVPVRGMTVVNDSYNANPGSVRAALDMLAEMRGARRLVLLGDMLELGESGPRLHEEIGGRAAEIADVVLAVGPLAQHIVRGARAAGAREVMHFNDKEEATAHLQSTLKADDILLVKASRGMALWEVVEAIG
jgi:UDP-N-acetylmuramoyl-tripeptide--D-alanyl-D-alanine ligase